MPVCIHERLPDVRIEPNRVLGGFLLALPSHEIPLDVCDNPLTLSVADLLHALAVHMEAAVSQSDLIRVCDHMPSIHRYHAVAVLVDVTVNPNELADWKIGFEGLSHGFDSSNFSGWLNN